MLVATAEFRNGISGEIALSAFVESGRQRGTSGL